MQAHALVRGFRGFLAIREGTMVKPIMQIGFTRDSAKIVARVFPRGNVLSLNFDRIWGARNQAPRSGRWLRPRFVFGGISG